MENKIIPVDVARLKGEYVYLRELKDSDVPILRKLAKDERLWEFTKTLMITETYDEQFDRYIATALDANYMGGQVSFVIFNAKNDSIVGMTRFYKIDPSQKRLSIGYTWYIPQYWGGLENKECKLLLLQYAIEDLGFQRVEFEVAHQNIRSQKAVQKIGGVPEGRLRKHGIRPDGTVRDTMVFSIIDDEWPEKKQRLLEMLHKPSDEKIKTSI